MNSRAFLSLVPFALTAFVSAQPRWFPVSAPTNLQPASKASFGLAADTARNRVVLFGGDRFFVTRTDETWEWDGSVWIQRNPQTVPVERFYPAMTYDPVRQRVVMFGGNGPQGDLDDTWEWDGTDWNRIPTPTSPAARCHAGMVYDAARGVCVLYGGSTGLKASSETWTYDGNDWTLERPTHFPPGRSAFGFAYDASREVAVLQGGGIGPGGPDYDDTWEWDGSDWTERPMAVNPGVRNQQSMAYDPDRKRVVLLGGQVGQISARMNRETWEYDGVRWLKRLDTSFVSHIRLMEMVYDPTRRQMFTHGQVGFSSTYGSWAMAVDNQAAVRPLGAGCGVPGGVPSLSTRLDAAPALGGDVTLEITNLPAAASRVSIPLGVQQAAVDLGAVGMPGCVQHLVILDTLATVVAQGSATATLSIPNDTALTGASVLVQAVVDDARANATGLAVSGGLELVLGY